LKTIGDEKMSFESKNVSTFFGFFCILQCIFLGSIWAAVGDNIALNKSYSFNLQPNYALCTDGGDKTDLTDGKYSEGYFWVQPGTVGWQNRAPVITIDLQKIESISGISYNTAAGTAGVSWPRAILILVSDNNSDYYFAGDLIDLSGENGLPAPQGYSTHRYKTCALKTKGRYVRLMVIPSGSYTFCDEIEVYQGASENLQLEPGERVEDVNELIKRLNNANGIRTRLLTDIQYVKEQIAVVAISEELRQQLRTEVSQIEGGLKTLSPPSDDFRAVIPLNPLHEELFRIGAKLLRAEGYPELLVWKNNKWDLLTPFDVPAVDADGNVELQVAMMLNEYRSEAFNISNFSEQTLTAKIKIDGLPSGINPDYISVHQMEYVDTREGVAIGAALPLAKKVAANYEIYLPAGMTRQVWLTFNPKAIPSGTYQGSILVTIGQKTETIPLVLTLYGIEFPEQPSLSLGMWDYTDRCLYDITLDNRMAAIQDMRKHFVNTPWATSSTAPWPSKITKTNDEYEMEIDFGNFEQWIELWEGSRYYAIFLNVSSNFGPRKAAMGTDEFRETVSLWAKLWGQHIRSLGLHPSQFLLLIVDEPKSQDQMDRIIAWAPAIKAGEEDFIIWEDPVLEPWSLDPGLFEASDTLCPNLNHYYRAGIHCQEFYEDLRQDGKTLWFYQCSGPARLLDPYYYHRLQQWHAWERGAEGVGFWAYGDAGAASSWNEYQAIGRTSFTPVYIDEYAVTTGKHWEAIREGIEDFEYLKILKDLLEQLEASGKSGPQIEQAKTLLQEAPQSVIGTFNEALNQWNAPKDRSVADQERVRVLQAIAELMLLK